jgi:endonuclease III
VCVARVPKCPQCLIADLCEYRAKTKALPGISAAEMPLKPAPAGAAPRKPARQVKA